MYAYYDIGDGAVDLLLNWGPIIFAATVPFVAYLIYRPGASCALRFKERAGSAMCVVAGMVG